MIKGFYLLATGTLILSATAFAAGQTTTTTVTQTPTTVTKTVQHPDGSFTVIEYPVKKEVTVTLDPVTIPGATGFATILRDDDGTRIKLNLTGVPKDVTDLQLYAVDPSGAVTSLGPIAVTDGLGTLAATTQLDKFMLIASPERSLTAYNPNTRVLFRSSVPSGFAVIPYANHGDRDGGPVGERVSAGSTSGSTPATSYRVPMLNIPGYRPGTDTHMKVNFSGAMTGSRANVFITPRKDGPTEVKLRFHELTEAPSGKVYVLWAVSPDNKFVKLGQIVNAAGRNEAEIRSETALRDFGLLVTVEEEVSTPAGQAIGIVELIP